MSVAMNKLLIIALALVMTGCATVRTLDAAKPGAPVVYAGTRLDMYAIEGGCCATDLFGAEAPSYPGVDLPASALLDTVLLPLSLLAALGFFVQATGGL
ncbi:Uncharacterized conserved protein YceK [Pseudomonas asturiensis]|uniref:Uncharacterized conserved protein YceK n=2 Tax=Pseudomonas asturiensis TaxID=1190415 RepID=A0A1M7P9T4_9PSED|nr:Uncharacterized conserved protein YceK [Pseudomonas asturiensis]